MNTSVANERLKFNRVTLVLAALPAFSLLVLIGVAVFFYFI